jgi:DNA-directed RNA polymerase specialized sigma24 family protein
MGAGLVYSSPSGTRSDEPLRRRGVIERLLDRANYLTSSDRALLRGIYDRGMDASDVARVMGRRPRGVRQRVQRLVEHLNSPDFTFILRAGRRWPKTRRRVGELVFLQGLTQREAAARLGISLHHLRREIERIRALIDEANVTEGADAQR